MRKITVILITFLLLLTGCAQEKAPVYTEYRETTLNSGFDTLFLLLGYTQSKEEFDQYFERMKTELTYYHQLFDKYHNYEGINNIKTINDYAGISPVQVDAPIIDMLLLAKEYYTITNGYFDVTMGSVLTLWHDCREDVDDEGIGTTPSIEALREASVHTGWDKVVIDETEHTVYLSDAKMSLDVGGIAKGYAVEQIAQILEEEGLIYGAINGGGNVRTIHQKPDGATFNIGIASPNNRAVSARLLHLPDSTAIVTSGDYDKYYYDKEGNRYHHIINPYTLYPSVSARSVTIVHANSAIADILSTALFIMDYDTAQQFLADYNDAGLGVLWLYDLNNYPDRAQGDIVDEYYEIHTENITSLLS